MAKKPTKNFGSPSLWRRLAGLPGLIRRQLKGRQVIPLDYRVSPRSRYGYGSPPLKAVYDLLNARRGRYQALLGHFAGLADSLGKIPAGQPGDPAEPFWNNSYLPPLDAIAIYSLIALRKPANFVEIGSGNSTMFARRAICDHNLPCRITSIDPIPRAEVNDLCDSVIRHGLEQVDLNFTDILQPGDILYMDGSHRCFQNSDVTVFFLEVLPRLRPDVLVGIHDVFLPADYPPRWLERFYSEQYVLAAYLLGKGSAMDIILPAAFVADDPELSQTLAPLAGLPCLKGREISGGSFWFVSG
ncbi:MAG: class I SAM-dependent methyltransferase [Planctomycetes bacterium]|nr:class I SAM-dependent methyltransferase [Planctomycetota bacterium]